MLQPHSRMVASRPLRSLLCAEGLVIDDFFSISFEPRSGTDTGGKALDSYNSATYAYESAKLLGSPRKDLVGTDGGMVSVAALASKRLGLSHLTLQLCRLIHTSDALHLCLQTHDGNFKRLFPRGGHDSL